MSELSLRIVSVIGKLLILALLGLGVLEVEDLRGRRSAEGLAKAIGEPTVTRTVLVIREHAPVTKERRPVPRAVPACRW